jgi:hypothetical protein
MAEAKASTKRKKRIVLENSEESLAFIAILADLKQRITFKKTA